MVAPDPRRPRWVDWLAGLFAFGCPLTVCALAFQHWGWLAAIGGFVVGQGLGLLLALAVYAVEVQLRPPEG